jgi:uncharacterized protein
MVGEYGQVSPDVKRKILGLNAARLYDIEVPDEVPQPAIDTSDEPSEKPAIPREMVSG